MFLIFAAGCVSSNSNSGANTYDEGSLLRSDSCIALCLQKANEGENLSSGPCLSNQIAPDLACDVAHNPRQPIDDLPENQCSAFRNGTAHHFIEVDVKCNLIRAV